YSRVLGSSKELPVRVLPAPIPVMLGKKRKNISIEEAQDPNAATFKKANGNSISYQWPSAWNGNTPSRNGKYDTNLNGYTRPPPPVPPAIRNGN
ncbi:unnamed protein product, partial [Cyprideis torosa]